MADRYILAPLILFISDAVDISKGEYESLIGAVDILLHCADVEENFDSLIENYRELEEFISGEALHAVFSRTNHDVAAQAPRNTMARKLSNFLSSVRLYDSTIETHSAAIVDDATGATQIKAAMSAQFDGSLNYRVMDALRNYAQHAALPVHGYTVGGTWTKDRNFLDFEFDPAINVADLAKDSRFKKKTLGEIIDGPPKLSLKPMMREYVESLSNIHHDFRQLTNHAVDHSWRTISEAKQRFTFKFPNAPIIGLAVYPADAAGLKLGEETNLSNMLLDYITFLRAKNNQLVNFTRRRIAY